MIGKAYRLGTGFNALAAYLEYGSRQAPVAARDRVDWTDARNLPTAHPQAAARIMAATARESDSSQPPVYHVSISFDPGDAVNRDTMRRVADRTLRDLGLQEHQVLIVAHRDRVHAHMHLMVNRVHPERLKVWSNWWDYAAIERSLRAQEMEMGLRVVPGRHAPVPEHAREKRAPSPRLARGDAEFVERARREAGPYLLAARSWAELEQALATHGLSIRAEGRGMVVTNGVHKAKCSDIDRAASRAALERRFGPLGEYRLRQEVAARTLNEHPARVQPEVPSAVTPQTPTAPPRAPQPPAPAPSAPAPPPRMPQPPAIAPQAPAPLPRAPQPPAPAPQPDQPAPDEGRAAPRDETERLWEERVHQRLRHAAERLRAAVAAYQSDTALSAAMQDEAYAEGELRELSRRRQSVLGPIAQATSDLRVVYQEDPGVVLEKLRQYAKQHGNAQMKRTMHDRPEQFGTLLRERPAWGLGYVWSTKRARALVTLAVSSVEDVLTRRPVAVPEQEQISAAAARLSEARSAVEKARAAFLGPRVLYEAQKEAAKALLILRSLGVSEERLRQELGRLLPESREARKLMEDSLAQSRSPERGRSWGRGMDF